MRTTCDYLKEVIRGGFQGAFQGYSEAVYRAIGRQSGRAIEAHPPGHRDVPARPRSPAEPLDRRQDGDDISVDRLTARSHGDEC
jgi:hypothetical protein